MDFSGGFLRWPTSANTGGQQCHEYCDNLSHEMSLKLDKAAQILTIWGKILFWTSSISKCQRDDKLTSLIMNCTEPTWFLRTTRPLLCKQVNPAALNAKCLFSFQVRRESRSPLGERGRSMKAFVTHHLCLGEFRILLFVHLCSAWLSRSLLP